MFPTLMEPVVLLPCSQNVCRFCNNQKLVDLVNNNYEPKDDDCICLLAAQLFSE